MSGAGFRLADQPVQRLRVRYAKRGRMRFTSHRDFSRAFERAVFRARVPMAYSSGFNPHPRISYAGAAPTGTASEAEYLELALAEQVDPAAVLAALNEALPDGLDVLEVVESAGGGLADRLEASIWRLELLEVPVADAAPAVERLLTSGLGMGGLLLAKWLYIASLALAQIVVMFVWGALLFGLPLAQHVPGFLLMTVCTAMAASAFGLVIATLARTRAQLSGLANLTILGLNALGGSMFPRFLMSETMQKAGLVTFNAWALDGYLKVFWRNSPLIGLWPQALVLTGLTIVFLTAARLLARRWETL